MGSIQQKLLVLAGVLATAGLYAMSAPAWLLFLTAAVVVVVAVLVEVWEAKWAQGAIAALVVLNLVLLVWALQAPADRAKIEIIGVQVAPLTESRVISIEVFIRNQTNVQPRARLQAFLGLMSMPGTDASAKTFEGLDVRFLHRAAQPTVSPRESQIPSRA